MSLHRCEGRLPRGYWGEAITRCWEEEDGTLWVVSQDREYGSQVNFCPYCGYEAKVKAKIEEKERRD